VEPTRSYIVRARPDKVRCNSAQTIRDTLRVVTDAVTLNEVANVLVGSSHPPKNTLGWVIKTWARSPICEWELRVTHDTERCVPLDMFRLIVARLQHMEQSSHNTTDHFYDSIRIRSCDDDNGVKTAIRKETVATYNITLGTAVGLHGALSFEYPCEQPTTPWSTRRIKNTQRFIYNDQIRIECSHVQFMSAGARGAMQSYEVEIELTALAPDVLETMLTVAIRDVCGLLCFDPTITGPLAQTTEISRLKCSIIPERV
jgi:hypothetical protein